MKKFFTTILAFAMGVICIHAAEHVVTNATEFNTAWTSYQEGDVIVFDAGTYTALGDKKVTKSVTLKASPTALSTPVLTGVQFIMEASCNFICDGLEVYFDEEGASAPTGKYFLQAVHANMLNGTIAEISIKNSNIHGFGRGLIRADNGTNFATITNLNIDNCLIWDMGRNSVGYSTIGVKTAKISNATIKNTTFYNSPNGTWNSEDLSTPINFLMENCNVLKTTTATSKLIITNKTNPGSVFTIKNCIISDSYDASSDRMQIKLADAIDEATVTGHLDNSILANHFAEQKVFGPLTTNTEIAVTSLTIDYSQWRITTSPQLIASIGDPRWSLNITTGINKQLLENTTLTMLDNQLQIKNIPQGTKVDVFTMSGALVKSIQANHNLLSIPVNADMLLVRITHGSSVKHYKVIR